jgi:hypothetical protein
MLKKPASATDRGALSARYARKARVDRLDSHLVSLVLPVSLDYPAGSGPVLPDMQAIKVLLCRNGFSAAC